MMDYVGFDWAMKRMLRMKANFDILEGLLSVLLERRVTIAEILESESNAMDANDKFNRVDIKAKDEQGEYFLIEIQLTRDLYFMKRILYGASKCITEHIELGKSYKDIKKVYSINILYFDLGRGEDYLYHGQTKFIGVHSKDELVLKKREDTEVRKMGCSYQLVDSNIFPEYYLIRVNRFNDIATTPIEEWLDFLKNGRIKEDTQTPGLQSAREKLRLAQMSKEDQVAYYQHLDAVMTQNDTIETYRAEGEAEGMQIGLQKGEAIGMQKGEALGMQKGEAIGMQKRTLEMARAMKERGVPLDVIAQVSQMSIVDIEKL